MALPRRLRLRPRRRIREVSARGRRTSGELGTVRVLPGETDHPRICLVFPGRLAGAAVRNRGRRRLQEVFRGLEPRLAGAWDIVFHAARPALGEDFEAVGQGLEELLRRAGVLE